MEFYKTFLLHFCRSSSLNDQKDRLDFGNFKTVSKTVCLYNATDKTNLQETNALCFNESTTFFFVCINGKMKTIIRKNLQGPKKDLDQHNTVHPADPFVDNSI